MLIYKRIGPPVVGKGREAIHAVSCHKLKTPNFYNGRLLFIYNIVHTKQATIIARLLTTIPL